MLPECVECAADGTLGPGEFVAGNPPLEVGTANPVLSAAQAANSKRARSVSGKRARISASSARLRAAMSCIPSSAAALPPIRPVLK